MIAPSGRAPLARRWLVEDFAAQARNESSTNAGEQPSVRPAARERSLHPAHRHQGWR